jgi:energy-coupling factor transporter transmembrane protein EcfT
MFQFLNTYRKFEVRFLILLCLFALPYSLSLGYTITHYAHGGQLAGIPFAIVLWLYSCFIFFSKKEKRRNIFRILNYTYILTMLVYITVMNILFCLLSKDEVFHLYYTAQGDSGTADYIFLSIAITGMISCAILITLYTRSSKYKEPTRLA